MQRTLRIEIELTGDEAWALAQFLKRAGYDRYRRLAQDFDAGDKMRRAGEVVRRVLSEAGASPR